MTPHLVMVVVPPVIARRIARLRASIRAAIQAALGDVARGASEIPPGAVVSPMGPPLRFYAGGYRVFYQVEADARRVVVLELRRAFT